MLISERLGNLSTVIVEGMALLGAAFLQQLKSIPRYIQLVLSTSTDFRSDQEIPTNERKVPTSQ
jgi:hypothetical protein